MQSPGSTGTKISPARFHHPFLLNPANHQALQYRCDGQLFVSQSDPMRLRFCITSVLLFSYSTARQISFPARNVKNKDFTLSGAQNLRLGSSLGLMEYRRRFFQSEVLTFFFGYLGFYRTTAQLTASNCMLRSILRSQVTSGRNTA